MSKAKDRTGFSTGPPEHKDPDSKLFKSRKGRARKNTRRWCKGKVGVEHKPMAMIPKNKTLQFGTRKTEPCYVWTWSIAGSDTREEEWFCSHELICTVCNKSLKWSIECPDKPAGMKQWLL